jgi:hypothetical protein
MHMSSQYIFACLHTSPLRRYSSSPALDLGMPKLRTCIVGHFFQILIGFFFFTQRNPTNLPKLRKELKQHCCGERLADTTHQGAIMICARNKGRISNAKHQRPRDWWTHLLRLHPRNAGAMRRRHHRDAIPSVATDTELVKWVLAKKGKSSFRKRCKKCGYRKNKLAATHCRKCRKPFPPPTAKIQLLQ